MLFDNAPKSYSVLKKILYLACVEDCLQNTMCNYLISVNHIEITCFFKINRCERKDSSRDNTNTESRAQRKLLAAVTSGSVAQIGHLVNARTINKLDLGIRDENGATCLDIAARSGDLEIVQQLIKVGLTME